MRPCDCDRVMIGAPFDAATQCRACWLFHHSAKYRAHWGETTPPAMVDGRLFQLEKRIDVQKLVADLPADSRKLLGDRVKQMTDALGIPTCGGCEARRIWLNAADAWIRARL